MVNLSRDMIHGLVRVRILRAASLGPVSGVEVSQELATAGHRVSPGTLYPLLHAMEKAGWVKSAGKTVKGKRRRYYRVTKKGRAQLEQALTALNLFLDGIVLASPTRARVSDPRTPVDAHATLGLLRVAEPPGHG